MKKILSNDKDPVRPPLYNMGVERTEGQEENPTGNRVSRENICLFDWLSFTIKKPILIDLIITDYLKMNRDDFVKVERGNYGYKNQIVNGNVRIYSDGNFDMGIHVQMSGQGCRQVEEALDGDWLTLIKDVDAIEGEFSRFDIAVDDRTGLLNIDKIYKKTEKKEYVSKFKAWDLHTSCRNDSDKYGKSVYFGSEKSDIKLRIYDKAVEQEVEGHWIRVEFQLRDERANKALRYYLQGKSIGEIVNGILNQYIRFVETDQIDSNKRRWKTSKFWDEFVQDAEKLILTSVPKKRTLDHVYKWVDKFVAPSLGLLYKASDDDMSIINKIVLEGTRRLKSKHLAMLQKNNQGGGVRTKTLSKKDYAELQRILDKQVQKMDEGKINDSKYWYYVSLYKKIDKNVQLELQKEMGI